MRKLIEIIKEAERKKIAVGHFNVSNLEQLKAVAHAGIKLNVPVIVGLSEGERDYFGIHHFRDLVASYNSEYGRENGFWLYTNADHTHSLEKVREAARVGFHAILFDGSRLSLEENIDITRKAVVVAKRVSPGIIVEGELGYIGSSSELRKSTSEEAAVKPSDLTKPEEAERFVKETGVDLLAPAVGNIHGMFAGGRDYPLDIGRIKAIKRAAGVPLVLHGASGNTAQELAAAIEAGIAVIHISTELRLAWRQTLEKSLAAHKEEIAPYKVMPEVLAKMESLVEEKLRLFNNIV